MQRITVVLEYPDKQGPRIRPDTKDFGHTKVYAVQFSDALLEIETLRRFCRY